MPQVKSNLWKSRDSFFKSVHYRWVYIFFICFFVCILFWTIPSCIQWVTPGGAWWRGHICVGRNWWLWLWWCHLTYCTISPVPCICILGKIKRAWGNLLNSSQRKKTSFLSYFHANSSVAGAERKNETQKKTNIFLSRFKSLIHCFQYQGMKEKRTLFFFPSP